MVLRAAVYVVMLVGAMYAATGLLSSLREFGIGMAVVALAVVVQGLLTYVQHYDMEHQRRLRNAVWERRDRG